MTARIKTDYPGVYYRNAKRIGGKGLEKVYYVVFKKNGKALEEKVGRQYADDITPARAALFRAERIEGKRLSRKEIKAREQAQIQAEKDRWNFDRLWKEYQVRNPNVKGIKTDHNRFKKHISPKIGKKEPKDLFPLDIDRLRINLLKKRKPGTVKNVMELIRRIINFGIKKRLCLGADFSIEMPKVNNLKTEDLTPGQLSSLLEAIEKDTHPQAGTMMKLALFTGMRRSEMFKLKWRHVGFERGFILLRDPKGGPDQKIPLNDASRKLLKSYPKLGGPFVFPGRGDKQRTDIHRPVNKIRNAAGLPKDFRSLHGLRHVYASMLASSGEVDLYTIQKLLTHKSPLMTQRYAHLRDDALKAASNVAGGIVTKALKKKSKKNVVKLKGSKK